MMIIIIMTTAYTTRYLQSETPIGARYCSVDTINLEFKKYLSILILKDSK